MQFKRFIITSICATTLVGVQSFIASPLANHANRRSATRSSLLLGMDTLVSSPTNVNTSKSQKSDGKFKSKESPASFEHMINRGGISMTVDELAVVLGDRRKAKLVWDCYSHGIEPENLFGEIIDLEYDDYETVVESLIPSISRRGATLDKQTLKKLSNLYGTNCKVEGGVAKLTQVSRSPDGSTKLSLQMSDGINVAVHIFPWKNKKGSTLSVSSQAESQQGKFRSLTSDEILSQMFFARKICRWNDIPEVSNVIFKGDEPANNCKEVIKATEILSTNNLFQLSASKVLVSTNAPTPNSFHQFTKAPFILSWNVHTVNDNLRKRLIKSTSTTTKEYKMTELRQGLIDTLQNRPMNFRNIVIDVTLLDNVNDSLCDANELGKFLRVITDNVPGCKLIVNLTPYSDNNTVETSSHKKPSKNAVVAFQKQLSSHGINTLIRETLGEDGSSAVFGQMANAKTSVKQTERQNIVSSSGELRP